SFAEDVKQLGYGAGEILRGEGILAITKAVLQSGVSYVGGYPGAPVSYLIDVLADANEPVLRPLGIYLAQSGRDAAAAAPLAPSPATGAARSRAGATCDRRAACSRRPASRASASTASTCRRSPIRWRRRSSRSGCRRRSAISSSTG